MNKNNTMNRRIRISGNLFFDTAFHIGSGKEGELATNLGVLREADGSPVLPGSTLKGCFRSFAEKISGYLGLEACLLDSTLSGKPCVSDTEINKKSGEEFRELKTESKKIEWLNRKTCDICRFFGSPFQASRIFFSDGTLTKWNNRIEIRDGVCIDRDTETARPKAKYDFEVVPDGTSFHIIIDLENPEVKEIAIVAAVLAEWESGFRLGGFTSRGLGRVRLTDKKVETVDYNNFEQLKDYLLSKKMTEGGSILEDSLQSILLEEEAKITC